MPLKLHIAALLTTSICLPAWTQEDTARIGQENERPQRPAPADVDLPEDGVTVVMERQLHLPVVRAWIDEEGPYRFGIDTGASLQLSVSPQLVEDLALAVQGEITASDGTGQNQAQRTVYGVPSLRIGEAEFVELEAIAGNYNRGRLATQPVDGIIGIGLFNGLTLTLDYPAERVRISTDPLPVPDGKEVLALHGDEIVPTIDWELGGQLVRAHIDARNMGGITLPQSFTDTLPLEGEPVEVGRARTQFNTIPILAAKLTQNLNLGQHVIQSPTLTFATLFRNANIGSRVMEHFRVSIDQKNDRIQFHRSGKDPIRLKGR